MFKPPYFRVPCDDNQVSFNKSSHWRCSVKKGALKIFTEFTGKLCWSLCFNKVAGLKPATLLKKRFQHRCFPVNSVKFLRTSFLENTSCRLLLILLIGNRTRAWKNLRYSGQNCRLLSTVDLLQYFTSRFLILASFHELL